MNFVKFTEDNTIINANNNLERPLKSCIKTYNEFKNTIINTDTSITSSKPIETEIFKHYCEACNYSTNRKIDYKKHVLSKKHQKRTSNINIIKVEHETNNNNLLLSYDETIKLIESNMSILHEKIRKCDVRVSKRLIRLEKYENLSNDNNSKLKTHIDELYISIEKVYNLVNNLEYKIKDCKIETSDKLKIYEFKLDKINKTYINDLSDLKLKIEFIEKIVSKIDADKEIITKLSEQLNISNKFIKKMEKKYEDRINTLELSYNKKITQFENLIKKYEIIVNNK
jgi:hypothetical protein